MNSRAGARCKGGSIVLRVSGEEVRDLIGRIDVPGVVVSTEGRIVQYDNGKGVLVSAYWVSRDKPIQMMVVTPQGIGCAHLAPDPDELNAQVSRRMRLDLSDPLRRAREATKPGVESNNEIL